MLVSGRDSARPALLELYREREEAVICSPLGIPELLGVRPQLLLVIPASSSPGSRRASRSCPGNKRYW